MYYILEVNKLLSKMMTNKLVKREKTEKEEVK